MYETEHEQSVAAKEQSLLAREQNVALREQAVATREQNTASREQRLADKERAAAEGSLAVAGTAQLMAAPQRASQPAKKVAFALGGLGGNNAHGAGVLQAALDMGVKPVIISCTSGQIYWVYEYLRRLAREPGLPRLDQCLADSIRETEPTGNRNIDFWTLVFFGKAGRFRPAGSDWFHDLWGNMVEMSRHIWKNDGRVLWLEEILQLQPDRSLHPDFPDKFFKDIANTFNNQAEIGIVFNSYSPQQGEERIYLNQAARNLFKNPDKQTYDPGTPSLYRDRTSYEAISEKAVAEGLWLFQYGCDGCERGFLDGTYFRGVILSELVCAERIYVARPVNHHWLGHMPRTYLELEDLKTEVWFNGSYAGERGAIELVNKLLKHKDLNPDKYRRIELHEIEIQTQRGYYDYIREDPHVFTEAYNQAVAKFKAFEP